MVLVVGGLSAPALGSTPFFDWEVPPQSVPAGFLGAPTLSNSAASASAVLNYWIANPSAIKAVRVTQDLTDPAAINVFRTNTVNYVLADLEGPSIATRTANLVGLVRWNSSTSANTPSVGAYIGNWQICPVYPDSTSPTGITGPEITPSGYYNVGTNLSMEALYPGSGTFRGPGTANGGSSSPNIRSNLFTLPITRFSEVATNLQATIFQERSAPLPAKDAHIPLVTRFNNWGNAAMDNSTLPVSPYTFDTSQPGAADQLLARGDFAAMIAHYRARGADSFNLFEPGVVGYTKAEMQSDAAKGWSVFDPLFASGRTAKPATLAVRAVVDGTPKTFEETGVAWSGMVQNPDGNPFTPDIFAAIVSNLDGVSHTFSFADPVDGKLFTSGNTFTIPAGSHRLIEFSTIGGFWDMFANQAVSGADGSWPDYDRNGIGIPEPTLGLVSLAAAGLLVIRRRSRA